MFAANYDNFQGQEMKCLDGIFFCYDNESDLEDMKKAIKKCTEVYKDSVSQFKFGLFSQLFLFIFRKVVAWLLLI